MASGSIKGITISFRGDTTKLDKALRQVNTETRAIDKELKNVDKALKFNPTNVDLWRQKQTLLTQKVSETKEKLQLLKKQQEEMDAAGVDKQSLEYQKLQREIIETESKVKTFEGQLKQIGNVNLKAASEQVKELGGKLTSAGQAMQGLSMAAAGVVAALGGISYKAGQNADDLNTMSKVYGISTGDLQKYKTAADLVDVSVEDIAKSQVKLKKSMYSAENGSKTQAEAFEKLGVSITNADGSLRDGEDVWQDTVKALGQMTNETERDALAQVLMGKSAANLNPLIEDQGETYKRVSDTMSKYGLDFVDQETLDKANEFNDQLDTMKVLGSVALSQVGSQLASTLAPALEKVVGWVGKFAEWLSKLDPAVLTTIGVIAGIVAAIAPVLLILGKLAFAVSSIMSLMSTAGITIGAIAGPIGIVIAVIAAVIAAFVLWRKHGDKIKKFFKAFGKQIAAVWDGIKEAISTKIQEVKTNISTVFNQIKSFILMILKNIVLTVTTQWNLIKTKISIAMTAIKTTITTVWNAIKTAVSTAVGAVKTKISNVWSSIQTATKSAWNAIKSAITAPLSAAKDSVAKIVSTISSKVSRAFNGLSSSVKTAFNAVKDAITGPIKKAKDTLDGIIDKIKGMFPLKLGKIFDLKLPKFTITNKGKFPWGLGGKGSLPEWDISWHKDGGIFKKPTIFAHGIGEAGAEAVVPLDRFWKTLEGMSTGETNIVINVNGANKDPREIAEEVKRVLIKETNQRRLAWQ